MDKPIKKGIRKKWYNRLVAIKDFIIQDYKADYLEIKEGDFFDFSDNFMEKDLMFLSFYKMGAETIHDCEEIMLRPRDLLNKILTKNLIVR